MTLARACRHRARSHPSGTSWGGFDGIQACHPGLASDDYPGPIAAAGIPPERSRQRSVRNWISP